MSYNPDYFFHIDPIESKHFWFKHRRHLIAGVVKQLSQNWESGYQVLEVGCGNGHILNALADVCNKGKVTGMELYAEGVQVARKNNSCDIIQGDITQPQPKDYHESFQLIGIFDVLEHIQDDQKALDHMYELLAEEGYLVLTVPANPRLWSYFDEASKHQRRYLETELTEKLNASHFKVIYVSPYMMPIYPLVYWGRKIKQFFSRDIELSSQSELSLTPGLNSMLLWLLNRETNSILQRRILPFGSSLIAIAQKVGI